MEFFINFVSASTYLGLGIGKFLEQRVISGPRDTYSSFGSKFLQTGRNLRTMCVGVGTLTLGRDSELFLMGGSVKWGFSRVFGSHLKLPSCFLVKQDIL